MKCNEEEKSLSTEAFSKVSLTNLRRPAVPDLSTDLGMNIFKKVSRRQIDFISLAFSVPRIQAADEGLLGLYVHAICGRDISFHWG